MTNTQAAPGVDRFAVQSEQMIPVPTPTNYGEREHITMQVRNAPNGQRATRQVSTSGVHHFDVHSYAEALHVNLYSDKSAGWLFLRKQIAEKLYEALGDALGELRRVKMAAQELDAIELAYGADSDLILSLDRIRIALGLPVVANVDVNAPNEDGTPNYSVNHA